MKKAQFLVVISIFCFASCEFSSSDFNGPSPTIDIKIPEKFENAFMAAEKTVSEYFQLKSFRPDAGSIEIADDRYILLRGASISVEFFQLCRKLFGKANQREADMFASSLLYELAHSIGISDAKRCHKKMGLTDRNM